MLSDILLGCSTTANTAIFLLTHPTQKQFYYYYGCGDQYNRKKNILTFLNQSWESLFALMYFVVYLLDRFFIIALNLKKYVQVCVFAIFLSKSEQMNNTLATATNEIAKKTWYMPLSYITRMVITSVNYAIYNVKSKIEIIKLSLDAILSLLARAVDYIITVKRWLRRSPREKSTSSREWRTRKLHKTPFLLHFLRLDRCRTLTFHVIQLIGIYYYGVYMYVEPKISTTFTVPSATSDTIYIMANTW